MWHKTSTEGQRFVACVVPAGAQGGRHVSPGRAGPSARKLLAGQPHAPSARPHRRRVQRRPLGQRAKTLNRGAPCTARGPPRATHAPRVLLLASYPPGRPVTHSQASQSGRVSCQERPGSDRCSRCQRRFSLPFSWGRDRCPDASSLPPASHAEGWGHGDRPSGALVPSCSVCADHEVGGACAAWGQPRARRLRGRLTAFPPFLPRTATHLCTRLRSRATPTSSTCCCSTGPGPKPPPR